MGDTPGEARIVYKKATNSFRIEDDCYGFRISAKKAKTVADYILKTLSNLKAAKSETIKLGNNILLEYVKEDDIFYLENVDYTFPLDYHPEHPLDPEWSEAKEFAETLLKKPKGVNKDGKN